MILDDIPLTSAAAEDAGPSQVVDRIRQYRPSRRTVLKGLLVAAAAAALVPLDWFLTKREAAAAGPTSEFGDCAPTHYDKDANNWWSDGSPEPTCYGGWRRGALPCASGYHREGKFSSRGETYTSTRVGDSCEGKNAWRWRGYRCSDALTETIFDEGDSYEGITISACTLSGNEGAAPHYVPPAQESSTSGPASRSGSPRPSTEPAGGESNGGGLFGGRR